MAYLHLAKEMINRENVLVNWRRRKWQKIKL
jgi:hypothetical protein